MPVAFGVVGLPEMRITIKYFNGHPELETDLSAFPLRARADRMRMLASLGLSVLNGATLSAGSPHTMSEAKVGKSTSTLMPDELESTLGVFSQPDIPPIFSITKKLFDQV
jgi:hypothetical protein